MWGLQGKLKTYVSMAEASSGYRLSTRGGLSTRGCLRRNPQRHLKTGTETDLS